MNCTGNCTLLGLPCECAPRRGRPAFRPCGTMAAYRRHQRHGETPCDACLAARRRHWADVEAPRQRERQRLDAAGLDEPVREFMPCGTMAAYMRHQRHGETPCDACLAANRAHQRTMYQRRKALAS